MFDQTCYTKSFLKEVIVRIDFVAAIEGLEKTLPPKLAKAITGLFPISEPVDAIARELQFSGEKVTQKESRFKQWNFFGKNREKHLALAAPFVFISYKRYTSFEEMKKDMELVLRSVEAAFPDASTGRLGLRYINVIDIGGPSSPLSWSKYINSALLGSVSFFEQPERHLIRHIGISELTFDEINVRFQFGMPNPDYPAMMRRPQFILDFDAYVQSAHDFAESLQFMDKGHQQIQILFESGITDQLRELMNDVRSESE